MKKNKKAFGIIEGAIVFTCIAISLGIIKASIQAEKHPTNYVNRYEN